VGEANGGEFARSPKRDGALAKFVAAALAEIGVHVPLRRVESVLRGERRPHAKGGHENVVLGISETALICVAIP
jgi:hypothetical protein